MERIGSKSVFAEAIVLVASSRHRVLLGQVRAGSWQLGTFRFISPGGVRSIDEGRETYIRGQWSEQSEGNGWLIFDLVHSIV